MGISEALDCGFGGSLLGAALFGAVLFGLVESVGGVCKDEAVGAFLLVEPFAASAKETPTFTLVFADLVAKSACSLARALAFLAF